jgi:hypothetical protein
LYRSHHDLHTMYILIAIIIHIASEVNDCTLTGADTQQAAGQGVSP